MKTRVMMMLAFVAFIVVPAIAQDGAKLYKQNCAMCHNAVGKGKLVGPDLKGVHTKYKDDWLLKWVKSSQSLVKKNDPAAVKVFNENNKMVMPDQSLTEDEIKSVVAYIRDESERLDKPVAEEPKTAAPAAQQAPGNAAVTTAGESTSSPAPVAMMPVTTVYYITGGIAAALLIVIMIMGSVIKNLAESLRKRAD